MKAIVVARYGDADQLQVADLPTPQPGANEVLVANHAAGVVLTDVYIRQGFFDGVWGLQTPYIPGWDFAGVVTQTGSEIRNFVPGDRVFGMRAGQGCYAESVLAGEQQLALIPSGWTMTQAAAFPLAATTAYKSLVETGHMRQGQRVLVLGAAGGVGSFGVLLARSSGATVIGAASTGKHAYLSSLGAQVFDASASLADWGTLAADLIFDTIGPAMDEQVIAALRPGGKVVRVAGPPGPQPLAATGMDIEFVGTEPNATRLTAVATIAARDSWPIPVAKTLPLAQASEAHRALEARQVTGKIVLEIAP